MDALLETLKNLGPARLAAMAVTFVGLVVFFAFIALRSATPNMTLLYSDLSSSDATQIATRLDMASIPYRLDDNGQEVRVSADNVGRARMLLAAEGLPSSGSLGYEIFDRQQSFGTTSFVQNINQLRALEGELARTISTLAQVRSARVHLVMPERQLFSRESQPATASVFINARNSAQIGAEQIASIQQMVASAVPQLQPSRVAIVDGQGNLLARGDDENTRFGMRNSNDMRTSYEQRLSSQIEDLVARIVGYGKVRAIVTADLDFSSISRNSEIYDPDGQVVRSTQTMIEDEFDNSGAANQAVTVENNLPGLPQEQAQGMPPLAGANREEEIINYEITRTIESVTRESGEIQRLSVAVLVDGRYQPAAGENAAGNEYVPRTEAELEQIRALVRSAIGYNEIRGDSLEVINMQFAQEIFPDEPADDSILGLPREQIAGIAETLIFSLIGVLVILLVLRPMVSQIASAAAQSQSARNNASEEEARLLAAATGQAKLAAPGGEDNQDADELAATLDMSNVEGQVKESSIKKINDLVDKHPNETVSVIRNWMTQES